MVELTALSQAHVAGVYPYAIFAAANALHARQTTFANATKIFLVMYVSSSPSDSVLDMH